MDEVLKSVDVSGCFSAAARDGLFPIGPHLILFGEEEIGVHLKVENGKIVRKDSDEPAIGLASIAILAPRKMKIPFLGSEIKIHNEKEEHVRYVLCRTCCELQQRDHPCSCTADERAIFVQATIPEINYSVELGYIIKDIFEVYFWPEGGKKIFSEYVTALQDLKNSTDDETVKKLIKIGKTSKSLLIDTIFTHL